MMGGYDKKTRTHLVAIPEINQSLGEDRKFMSEKLGSKSLETALGKGIHVRKKRVGRSFVTFITAEDFSKFTVWLASTGHKRAQALALALINEAIERRIDAARGLLQKLATAGELPKTLEPLQGVDLKLIAKIPDWAVSCIINYYAWESSCRKNWGQNR
ncbi:hypothetical protein BZZ01_13495 [Nostocales cyanobacterium HT-58-2]|nr:hypothetical protein BZZ01_13495 [Nostocales cyanobacterium HT-58-2]